MDAPQRIPMFVDMDWMVVLKGVPKIAKYFGEGECHIHQWEATCKGTHSSTIPFNFFVAKRWMRLEKI